MTQLSHIYISKQWGSGVKIKLLCTDKWVVAEEKCPDISHRCDGYKINGVHQWSIGAGHNADCPKCLVEYAKRKMKTDNILIKKILQIAEGNLK